MAGEVMILKRPFKPDVVVPVVRRMKAQVIVLRPDYAVQEARFWIGGREVGGYDEATVVPATPELVARVRAEEHRRALEDRVRTIRPDRLTMEQLEAIAALLTPE